MPAQRTQWIRGVLDLCILGTLRDRERYGYDIARRIEQAGLGRVKGGTLYPLLGRLEEAGLLTAEWRPGDRGPGRRYYLLTAEGRKLLDEQRTDWKTFAAQTTALLDEKGSK